MIGSCLMDAWQNRLQTEGDPVAGRWFRQGPDNSPGLFGGLPNDSPATNTLSWQVTNTVATTKGQTRSVKTGLSEKITAKGTIKLVEVSSVTTLSCEYACSWTETQAVTRTEVKTFTASIPLKVPQGRACKLLVLADRSALTSPYSAKIRLKGVSEANFEHAVNGKTRHSADAGTICSWINQYGSAGDDAMTFAADPDNAAEGIASIRGDAAGGPVHRLQHPGRGRDLDTGRRPGLDADRPAPAERRKPARRPVGDGPADGGVMRMPGGTVPPGTLPCRKGPSGPLFIFRSCSGQTGFRPGAHLILIPAERLRADRGEPP